MSNFLFGFVVSVFFFMALLQHMDRIYDDDYRTTCKELGGVPIITNKKDYCLNPSVFIEMEKK